MTAFTSSHSARRASGAMKASALSFRRALLANMVTGIKAGGVSSRSMTFSERMRLVRVSADVAMATARGGRVWSTALINGICKQDPSSSTKVLVKAITGRDYCCDEGMMNASVHQHRQRVKVPMWRKIVKRGLRRRRNSTGSRPRVKKVGAGRGVTASSLAERMVRRRTQVLKRLVPGGESLDECSLLGETLDYIVSLRAQVEVMRSLAGAMELLNGCSSSFAADAPQG